MNLIHRWLCSSARWKKVVGTYILPWTLEGLDQGSDVLEVGPGPGASTDLLRARVVRLTCVEADHGFAEKLRRRLGPVFASHGWVFFGPYRRQGLSASAGPYIGDQIAAAEKKRTSEAIHR